MICTSIWNFWCLLENFRKTAEIISAIVQADYASISNWNAVDLFMVRWAVLCVHIAIETLTTSNYENEARGKE